MIKTLLLGGLLFNKNDDGSLLAVILQPKAYKFFIQQVEQKEDEMDSTLNEPYDKNSKTLDDLMKE